MSQTSRWPPDTPGRSVGHGRSRGGLPDGLVAVVKAECETCQMVARARPGRRAPDLTVSTQDDPAFPPGIPAIDDGDLG